MKLIFATHNKNKAKEIQALMPKGITIQTLDEIGCFEDIPETAETLEGNAILKAEYVADKYKVACFADDTGLEIETLNMEPGVYSARYAGKHRNSDDNMNLVLKKLDNSLNRTAQFRTAICYINNGQQKIFEEIVTGRILTKKRGTDGFGYDPIFEPENSGLTFAEMSMEEKNKRSHRARAFEQLIEFLKDQDF